MAGVLSNQVSTVDSSLYRYYCIADWPNVPTDVLHKIAQEIIDRYYGAIGPMQPDLVAAYRPI